MRTIAVLALACGVGCDDPDQPVIEGDQACVRAKAMSASWPNGMGYCSFDSFVRCEGTTGTPMDCGAHECTQYAVPRTIVVGCNLDEANSVCAAAPHVWVGCDGTDELVCLGGRLFARHPGVCSAPLR